MGNKPSMTAAEARAKYLAEKGKQNTATVNSGNKPNMTAAEARAKYLAEKGNSVNNTGKANAWIDRYNATVKGIADYDSGRNGRYASDISGGYGADIDALISEYERNQMTFDGYELNGAYQNLKELQGYIREGNKPESKVVPGSPLVYGQYAQQSGVEKVLNGDRLGQLDEHLAQSIQEREERRKTTRDGKTIQKELDEVNLQLQELYKPHSRKNVVNGAETVISLISGRGLAGAAAAAGTALEAIASNAMSGKEQQNNPQIATLEQRKKELEEEQRWAQYFADEKYQLDSAGWAQKYAGKSYGQLRTVIEYGGLYGTDEHKWLQEYAPTTMTAEDKRQVITENENEIVLLEAVLKEYEGLAVKTTSADDYSAKRRRDIYQQYGSEKDIRARITELKDENWKLGNEIAYAFLEENEDFGEKSGYVTTARDVKSWEKVIDPYNPGFGDLMYEYINNQPGARNAILKYFSSNYDQGDDGNIIVLQKFSLMEPEEVKRYNYLYATQGKNAASKYLDYLTYELNARAAKNLEKEAQEMAQGVGGGIASSVLSVPINLVSGVGLVDASIQKLQNSMREKATGEYRPVDYNTTAMGGSKVSSTIRGTVSGNIAKATGTINMDVNKYPTISRLLNGKSLGDVYQLGMSMADSAAVAAMAPVLGSAGTVLLGGSAGTQGMLDAVANGATDQQALTMGVLNGAFEMIFEKVSIDKLLNGSSGNIVKDILVQGITEGSEEAFTSIANTVADIVVMAEKSDWEKGIAAYMEQGMSREEAETQAFWDVAIQIGWDFVGGMASGGIMGGSNYGINSAKQKKVDAQLQQVKEILESQTPVNPVAEQTQQMEKQAAEEDLPEFSDVVMRQVIENMGGPLESKGQPVGTREQQEQVTRLSKITGREVVLFEGAPRRNGFFSRKDGKIHINVNGVDPVVQIFSHELTHSVEGAKVYNDLKTYAFDMIQKQGGNIAQLKAEKIRLYEREGEHLDSLGAEKELVAEYVSQYLLTDEQTIKEVCRSKPTVGQQILNWIDRFLAKLGVTNADRAALEHAKILYAKALNQTQSSFDGQTAAANPTQRGSQQATADNAAEWAELEYFRNKATQSLEAGEMSEAEYDQMMDIADEWEAQLLGKGDNELQRSVSYSISTSASKKDVVSGLKDILRRGGDINELRQYVAQVEQTGSTVKQNAPRADQNTREAEHILVSAKQQGISVEEYLSQNWELYETENGWDPAARKALELETGDSRQYSVSGSYDYSKSFAQQIDDYKANGIPVRDTLVVGGTPKVYQSIGFNALPMTIDQTHIDYALYGLKDADHNLGEALLKQLPESIKKPVAVFVSNTHGTTSVVSLLNFTVNGKQVVAPIVIDGYGVQNSIRIDSNAITSVYGKDTAINQLYKAAMDEAAGKFALLYANKKEALSLLQRAGHQLSGRLIPHDGFYHSIRETHSPVKPKLKDVTESLQFKRWFGDWQKHSKNASKVVNSDGTPKVVYHGTNKNFFVFNSKSGLFWFSEYEDYAESMMEERGGGEVKAVYLNMRNPYRAKLPPGQFTDPSYEAEIIRKAKAGRHDGIIIECDTTNPIEAETFYVVFKPEQIKSATDNIGTFDKNNPDIRYSISDTQAETEGEKESVDTPTAREQLPRKAQEYLKRAERKLLRDLAGVMNAHRFADRSYLQEVVQQISEEYLTTGTVSQETLDNLFAQAYTRGIVVDTEFYNQFKEVKDYLRTMSVTLAQRDTQDIADWHDFRVKANKYRVLRIVDQGGLPVDTAYRELQTMAPGLFPESIAHPADQLLHMYEVGKSITKSEKSLKDYHSADAQTFRKWAKNDFDAAVGDIMKDLQTVKRFADEKAARDAEEAEKIPVTQDEAKEAYAELKQARRTYEKAMAKNLLSEHDEMQVGRLLKGEILPEHLEKEAENVKGILAVYEAKKDYERLCGIIGEYKRHRKGELRKQADSYLQNAGEWVDKKIGLLYSRETMRRNIQDIVKDQQEAAAINDEYFDPIQVAEAEATRFKNWYRERIRGLNLSTKARQGDMVSEAHAVQLLGEVQDNIRVLENAKGRIRQKDGKTLAEWRAVIDEMWQSSPSLDKEKIDSAVREFRYIYDQLFEQMNAVRVRNGYEPVNYRKGYFPHFQPGGDGIIAQFGKALGISTEVNALPTTINGLTHTFKPGIQWFGNAQERLGFNTAYDAVEGFDKYIEGVASVIHQTDNIQKLRALAAQVRYRTTDEGIRQQVDEVLAKDTLTEEEKQARINEIYEHGRFTLSNFVVELDEYTNLLANKKSKLDRTMEGLLGRRAYTVMKNIESRVGANMIAGNLSSALTNFIPMTQASAQLDRFSLLRGMWSALQSYRHDDGIVGLSAFLTNRRGSDPLIRTWAEKVSGVLSTPMELIDTFVSDSIVRAAYFQNLRRGMSETEAMHQADIFAAGVIADRSKGSMPTLFESTNPIFKAFTQFQLEVNNQFSEVFKDLPRNHGEKGAAMLALVLLKYFLGAWLFDEAYEYFIGRRPALDPIDMLNSTVGDLTGYEMPNILELGEGIITGEMPSFETEKVGFGKAMTNLGTGMLEELPFSAGLGLLGVELDGGRIPISSAIPDLSALWDAATDTKKNGKKRWKEAQTELNKLAYIVPPFGGNQISKIWKGVKAYIEGGSYGVDNEGNDILQYPVYKDDPQDAFWSLVRATIMGKSALPEAQEWVDSGFDSFTAKQTAIYQDLLDAGVQDREAYGVLREFEGVTKTLTESKETRQRQFLRNSDLSDEGKAIIYYGMLASDKDQLLMDKLTDMGADPSEAASTLMDIQDAENSAAIRAVIAGAKLTDQEKVELYRAKVSNEQDADIAALTVVGLGFDDYLKVYGKKDSLKKDKSVGNKGLEFSYWVDSQGYSEKQADAIKACFGDDDTYEKYVDKGLDPDVAYELADEIDDLEPMVGKRSVAQIQKWRVCVDFTDDEDDQMTALYAVMNATEYQKVEIARDFGVIPRAYVSLEEALPLYDADGNGSFKQAEITAAIDTLECSNDVKAVLWQMTVGKNTKWKNNPYSQKIGQQVYEARQAAPKVTDEESTLADDFSAAIAAQWG